MGDIADMKKRVKALLQEPENMRCSECRSKKNKPKFFSLLQTPERGQLGVFCCKDCHLFHVALGEEYATVKSLKKPEEWTEQDVDILEKSGNKAVNAIYESGLEGNHTDEHMGALASAAFVDMKYKQCVYFSEKALEEQLQLRAMIQFAKDQKPREQPAPLTMEDQVKKALKRQSMMPVKMKQTVEEKEEVLLRGFGESVKDEDDRKPRRTSGRGPPPMGSSNEEKRSSGGRKKLPRKSHSWDSSHDAMPKASQRRGGKKPGPPDLPSGSVSRRGGPRSSGGTGGGGLRRTATSDITGDNYDKRSFRRSAGQDPHGPSSHGSRRPQRVRRVSTMEGGELPRNSHARPERRPRRGSTMDGDGGGGNARLRRSSTMADRGPPPQSRGSGGSGSAGLRRANTTTEAKTSRPGDRLAKRGGSGSRGDGRHARSRSGSSQDEMRTSRSKRGERISRAERRSVSPSRVARKDRSISPSPPARRNGRGENRSLSPVRISRSNRKRSPGPNGSVRSFNSSARSINSSFDSSEQRNGKRKDSFDGEGSKLLSDNDSLLDESAANQSDSEDKDRGSWMDQIEGVAWSRSSAKALIDQSLNRNGSDHNNRRSSSKKQVEVDPNDSQSDDNLSWTEQIEGVTWSRSSAKAMIEKNKSENTKRGSARRQMLLDAGSNLEEAIPAFHKQQQGEVSDHTKESQTQQQTTLRRESSSTAEMTNLEQDSQLGAEASFATGSFATDAFALDAFRTSDAFGSTDTDGFGNTGADGFGKTDTDAFGKTGSTDGADDVFGSFADMGFPDFSASSSGGLDDEDDACLLSKGVALSSQ